MGENSPPVAARGLLLPLSGSPTSQEAARFLESGFERLLKVLVAALVGAGRVRHSVPAGFVGRFEEATERPTLGGLLDLVLWSSGRGMAKGLPRLEACLTGDGREWLLDLVRLRNLWFHPRDEDPSVALEGARQLLAAPPGAFKSSLPLESSGGRAAWYDECDRLPLDPLVIVERTDLQVFSELDRTSGLRFSGAAPKAADDFRVVWTELRVVDMALADPTRQEFHAKLRRIGTSSGSPSTIWWLDRLSRSGASGFLMEGGQAEAVLAVLPSCWPDATGVSVRPGSGEQLMRALASRAGLASPPSTSAFRELASADAPLVLAVRTDALGSRDFLDLLRWLFDFREGGPCPHHRILIERGAESLSRDEAFVLDRLPEGLEEVLRRPSGSRGGALADFVWPSKPRGGLLGWLR